MHVKSNYAWALVRPTPSPSSFVNITNLKIKRKMFSIQLTLFFICILHVPQKVLCILIIAHSTSKKNDDFIICYNKTINHLKQFKNTTITPPPPEYQLTPLIKRLLRVLFFIQENRRIIPTHEYKKMFSYILHLILCIKQKQKTHCFVWNQNRAR